MVIYTVFFVFVSNVYLYGINMLKYCTFKCPEKKGSGLKTHLKVLYKKTSEPTVYLDIPQTVVNFMVMNFMGSQSAKNHLY